MSEQPFSVLFLCTANSARSIIAESIIDRLGRGKFRRYSAGGHPKGELHPMALYERQQNNSSPEGLRSRLSDTKKPAA